MSLLISLLLSGPIGALADRPNVIVILADDLGYETIGANGGTSYHTPSLDRLAASGVRFEQFYAQPLCTPTRVQLMTGALNIRNYTTFGELDPRLQTFGHLFRKAGYKTAVAGKWQLGRERNFPQRMGFDESCLWHHTRRPARYANPGLEYNGVEKDFDKGEYGPDLVHAFAEDFIRRHRDEAFFLYYPMILTHGPYQPTPDSVDWDPSAQGEKVGQSPKHFGDMVAYMDKLMGKLVATLDELQLRERTMIVFLGDNGTGKGVRSRVGNQTVMGGKGSTTRFGMHVPLIVDWPGHVQKGGVVSDLMDTTDVLPTIAEAAGIGIPDDMKLDGRSFLPQLKGEKGEPREALYAWYSPHREPPIEFAFTGEYKLYKDGRFFDLAADPEEKNPLPLDSLDEASKMVVEQLRQVMDRYAGARPEGLDDVVAPRPKNRRKRLEKSPSASL